MSGSTKVSIVTPSFNQGCYIEDTIFSVLNQSYENIEYIIVDGGSTDSTNDIFRKYQGEFELIQGQDSGQTDAINIGLQASSGDLVGWINSDDAYELDCVERSVNEYRKCPNAAIYYGAIRLIDEKGNFLGFPKWGPLNYRRLIRGLPSVWQVGSFYPRHLVEEVGYLDDSLYMCMDADLYLKLLRLAPAHFLPEFVARQRVHEMTKTSRHQILALREGFHIRRRLDAPVSALATFLIRRFAYLAKFYLFSHGKVVEWSYAENEFVHNLEN